MGESLVESDVLQELVGEEVGGICFVRTYVELYFDGPVLRALARPTLAMSDSSVTFPEPGSRDALCTLIGKRVEGIRVIPGEVIELAFQYGDILTIPLDSESRVGPEAAQYTRGIDQGVFVW